MTNERITEDIVRTHFKNDPLFKSIKLEEQKSQSARIRKCLSKASKNQTEKPGFPEFIISIPALPDEVIIVECKPSINLHCSSEGKQNVKKYAVDGVKHYSEFLNTEFNVLAIAVSGKEQDTLRITSFYREKGSDVFIEKDNKLLDIYSYLCLFKNENFANIIESQEITRTAIELNNTLNDYSIPEYERCTLISAILLALQDEGFRSSYSKQASTAKFEPRPHRVAQAIVNGTKQVLQDNKIDQARVETMVREYEKIKNNHVAMSEKIKKKKDAKEEDNYVLRDITIKMETAIFPLLKMGGKGYDVLGRFYTEFIRYAGNDKKLGLVLTPQHIAELFCDIANISEGDIVFDSCCGTGSFLIAAMKKMLELAGSDQLKRDQIKRDQLLGIEIKTHMFTYACSNMMMRGDGKSHIYQGDSFSESEKDRIRSFRPTVAFLNPPYDVEADGQLDFIENALSLLERGGRCVAIVQMSCACSTSSSVVDIRKRILEKHTLRGVLSMPNDLFHPVGVIACIMVFTAHEPQPDGYDVFFGYYKDDGFEKSKKTGRADKGSWNSIKEQWLKYLINRQNVEGMSVLKSVTAHDEWCAEAYMKTDYSTLSATEFEEVIKDYISYKVKYG